MAATLKTHRLSEGLGLGRLLRFPGTRPMTKAFPELPRAGSRPRGAAQRRIHGVSKMGKAHPHDNANSV